MRRSHSKDTIIQAGLEIVLQRGFNGTGVEAILKHANVPKGSFYNFFSTKEEFGLAIIDNFAEQLDDIMQSVLKDDTLNPLKRIRKCFEKFIDIVETNNCNGGCLLANLSLEMADTCEPFRQRLDEAWQHWAMAFSAVLLEAQKEKTISADLDPEMLAENMITSYEGALLRAKVKKSTEPLKNFIHLYFDKFLTQRDEE
jgi:TetR/AcrR family transcriptional repressor of nem operon